MDLSTQLYQEIRKDAAVEIIDLGQRKYASRQMFPVLEPTANTLEVTTLSALVDYLRADPDGIGIENLVCHVKGPLDVAVYSHIAGPFRQRETVIRVEREIEEWDWNDFTEAEMFNIRIQSRFEDNEDKEAILK